MSRLLRSRCCIDFRNSHGIARQLSSTSDASEISRSDLVEEAGALTRSLYRLCLRSVKVIRYGNEFDEKEFQKREDEFANPTPGVFSMAPPPNREDELRSRAEYYQSYTREYFIQESDCLDNDPLHERDIRRYLYYLRKGEKDRKWLLGDMLFPDPYKTDFDLERVERFEAMVKAYLGEDEDEVMSKGTSEEKSTKASSKGDDYFADAEDDLPDWVKKHMK